MKPDKGSYVEHPAVHEEHCTWLKVHVDPATPAHTDGELFDRQIHDLEYRIYPSRVPILMSV
jgi:diacylglycerol kinase family enzyme